jgi:diadenosine tetraphosphate (Ap4A) HIT family hydrolase
VPCLLLNAQADPPIRERILVRDGWRVAHNFETSLPGWLVAVPLRHITRISELHAGEAAALGPLLPLHPVLKATEPKATGAVAERPGFAHIHFHVVPRMSDFGEDDPGPRVMRHLGDQAGTLVSADEMDRLARKLQDELAG